MRSTLLWLRKWLYAIGGVIVFTSSLISPTEAFGQTKSYVVTELTGEDAAQVPSKLNNRGDIVGRNADSGEGAPWATLWGHSHCKAKLWAAFPVGVCRSANDIIDYDEADGLSHTRTAILQFV